VKRNLRFWTRYTWECTGLVLCVTVVLAALCAFSEENLDVRTFATATPYFLCVSTVFCILMGNSGTHTLYVPLLLSMGETRKNVLAGFLYFRGLIIAVTTALCALIWLAAPGEASAVGLRSIPTILCVLLTCSNLGSIMGTLFVKWKWAGMIVIIIICGVGGGLVGFASAAGGGPADKRPGAGGLSGSHPLVAGRCCGGLPGAGPGVPVAAAAAAGSKAVRGRGT